MSVAQASGAVVPLQGTRRVALCLGIGAVAALGTVASLGLHHAGAGDFTWALGGAHDLLLGRDPYTDPAFQPTHPYPHSDPIFYPLPALVLAIPFLLFPPVLAAALFLGSGATLLALALTRQDTRLLPLFLSAPFFTATANAQWSPLVTAAALLPWLSPILIAKPNLAVGLSLAWPRWLGLAVGVLALLVSGLIEPTWTGAWLHNLSRTHHPIPITILPGPLLLLAAFRWREPRARLLLGLALTPQFFYFYDQLPLLLIPRTRRQSLVLALFSWAAYFGWMLIGEPVTGIHTPDSAPGWVILFLYLPSLVLVLKRRRESPPPSPPRYSGP